MENPWMLCGETNCGSFEENISKDAERQEEMTDIEKSSPKENRVMATADHSSPSDELEIGLRVPLLRQLTSLRTKSIRVLPPVQHLASDTHGPVIDNMKPPYKVETDISQLFKAMVAVLIYFAFGTLTIYFTKNELLGIKTEGFIDALYFCVVTLTTVGYGDLVPGTTLGKLFISLYVFLGFGLVGALVSGAANYIVEMQERTLVHSIKRKELVDYELSEEMDHYSAQWKLLVSGSMVLVLIILGILCLITVEGMDLVDAVYCVCVTVTTLGYGDHSFRTAFGRLFGAVWIFTSTVFVTQFFLYLAEWRTLNRQLKLAHWVLHRRTTQTDLQAADLDGDGIVGVGEFVVFKLKELGKIDDEDVQGIVEEFRQLDFDKSGTISAEDLAASQPC